MAENQTILPSKVALASLVLLYSGVPDAPERGRLYPLKKKKIIIGSAEDADIQLSAELVEPYHIELRFDQNRWWLFDMSQNHNICVNGIPVEIHSFQSDGQIISVGEVTIKFLLGQGYESQCFSELYERTTTDFLTNMFNKEFFQKTLEREITRAFRYKRDLSLILIDLDYFGKVNKQYGQLAGDAVLKEVSSRMKQCMRTPDTLGRVGGEEFAALLPETNMEQARELAERLRFKLEEYPVVFKNIFLSITLSAGVTVYQEGMSADDLFEKANQYLHQAKSQGRNQVVS